MTHRAKVLASLFFLAVIATPIMYGALIGYTPTKLENRPPLQFPNFSDVSLDTKFFNNVRDALQDHMPLRAELVQSGAWLDMALFNHSSNKRVKVGRGGWLFYDAEIYARCEKPSKKVAYIAEGLKEVGDLLAKHGIDFIFTMAPNKSAIYPEYLGAWLTKANECPVQRRQQSLDLLPSRAGPYFLDLWSDLLSAKSSATGLLYYSVDTHWNAEGAAVACKSLINRLRPGLWSDANVVFSPPKSRLGDLASMQGLQRVDPERPVKVSRPGVVAKHANPPKGIPESNTYTASSSGPPLMPGRTVLLHDSFFGFTGNLLAPYFEEITFVHLRSRNLPKTLELIANSDRVIIAVVERDAYDGDGYISPDFRSHIEQAMMQRSVASRH